MSNTASGWLCLVTIPGYEQDTRGIKSHWAAWFPDQSDALKAIHKAIGDDSVQIATDRWLTDTELKVMGLKNAGDVLSVRTEL